jgi:hypothetical protein
MKTSKRCAGVLTVAIVVALVLFTAPTPAHADTYRILLLESASNSPFALHYPIGITDSGTVVLFVDPTNCNGTPGHCYETFDNGALVSKSLITPDLAYDNGTGCAPDASFSGPFSASVCNNGREVYGTYIDSRLYTSEIFTGPDPVADFFASGELESVYLNSSGDFVYWINARGESNGSIYEAIDLTTDQVPEPASIFLLSTGLLAAAGTLRRRLFP